MSEGVKGPLLEGAATEQRKKGMLPTTVDNERYLVDVLNRMDRKKSDAKATIKAPVNSQKKPGAFEAEAKRRGYELAGNWRVTNDPKPLAAGGSTVQLVKDTPIKKRLRMRIRAMQDHPEFRAKMKRINPLALQGQLGKDSQHRAKAEWDRLLDLSNKKWGEWWKPPHRALFSHAGQVKR